MASSMYEKHGITQFDGKNYDHWKFRMLIILEHSDVLKCIEQEHVNTDEAFLKMDRKCKNIIVQCIANSHLEYIKDKKTAFQMWESLKKVFERKGLAGQLYLRKKLLTMKFESGTLESHFIRFEETVRELRSVGAKLEEADVVCHLLLTLPKSYDTIITALETLEPDKLSLEFVKGKLLDHDIKKKNSEPEEHEASQPAAFNSAGNNLKKWKKKCHKCGKIGHLRKQCWSKKGQGQACQANLENQDDNNPIGFIATAMNCELPDALPSCDNSILWIVDSGATDHMINSDRYFSCVSDLEDKIKISVAKTNHYLLASKIGKIDVKLHNSIISYAEIKDVLYVENLRNNLLSVQRLEKQNLKVTFEKNEVCIHKNDLLLAKGKRINNLYTINFNLMTKNANVCSQSENLNTWHCRLGHLGNENLLKLSKLVDGININKNDCNLNKICSVCAQSNIKRLPFAKVSRKVTKKPLELVHSDVCGPISPCTYDEKRYFLTFLDDFTHFSVVYLIKNKYEVLECFKKYEAFVTNKFDHRIGTIRCDNAKEYSSFEFKSFCKTKGTQIRYTVPYNPEQNGAAERLNRTLLEKGRAMLLQSKLPKEMWGEAILAATYLLNRSPTASLRDVTPAEMFYGIKPNLKNIKIFGCLAYNHLPKQIQKGKFEPKGIIHLMIGYTDDGFRLWNPIERKVITGRNVIFDEAKNINDVRLCETEIDVNETENNETKQDIDVENNVLENDSLSEEDTDRTENKNRRSSRTRNKPEYLRNYICEDDLEHIALNAMSFIDDVPQDIHEATTKSDSKFWEKAIAEEINAINKNKTWTIVEKPEEVKPIDCKWVFRKKTDESGSNVKYKARLVARGFMQKKGFDFDETYAPVARLTTVRTILAVSSYKRYQIQQLDVKSAFLQGKVNENIYMTVPDGFDDAGKVCKLNKALYGLKQAPYCWNKEFDEFTKREGLIKSAYDPCLYINKTDVLYLLLYVDDILIISDNGSKINSLKVKLQDNFEMQDMGNVKTFLGINIKEKEEGISLSQKDYILKLLYRFNMSDCKAIKTPMEVKTVIVPESEDSTKLENKPVRELIGCLMYLMLATRPDISIAVNLCSRQQNNPTQNLWKNLKRILRYLKGTINLELIFLRNIDVRLVGYADADWAGDSYDRKSTSGYLFKIFGGTVVWNTRKQATVAMSSTESEYVALAEAAKEGIWLQGLIAELGFLKAMFTIFEDNQSCIKLTSRFEHKRLKHIDVKFNYIRDLVLDKKLCVQYISTNEQTADILTKNLSGDLFIAHRLNLGLRMIV